MRSKETDIRGKKIRLKNIYIYIDNVYIHTHTHTHACRFAFMKNYINMWMHLYIKDILKEITCLYVCLPYHNPRCKKLCLIHL